MVGPCGRWCHPPCCWHCSSSWQQQVRSQQQQQQQQQHQEQGRGLRMKSSHFHWWRLASKLVTNIFMRAVVEGGLLC